MWIKWIAALLPAIALLAYIYWRDPQKEPFWQLFRAVLLGVVICIPVGYAESFVSHMLFGVSGAPNTLLGSTIEAFCVAAIPEECAKLLALWLVLRRNPYFDERFDGIVYAVCVGLGFAAVENVFYVLGNEDWQSVAISRALLSVPGHYAFAIMMGYCYSVYHFVHRSPKNAIRILLLPVMAHGIYDALAMSGRIDPVIGGLAFIVLIYFCIKIQKLAQKRVIELIEKDKKA